MSKKLLKNCIVCNVEFTSFPSQKQKLCSLNCSHINQSIIMSGRPSHRRGKTIEEICGEEKGKELRKWYSQKYSGSGNSNYGGSFHGNRKLASKNARKSRLDRIKKDGYRDINAAINLKNTVGTTEINACEDMNVAIADSVQESTSFRSW